jgi:MerR family redox-sensitive transcriptional activator SoxR
MEELTIGEVARRSGVRTSTLRYYEQARILPPPRRVNGRRRYDPVVLRMLDVLRYAQGAGFTLDEIRTLFHGFGADVPMAQRWRALAHDKLRELDELIERAHRMKQAIETGLGCGCVRLEDCVTGVPCEPEARGLIPSG